MAVTTSSAGDRIRAAINKNAASKSSNNFSKVFDNYQTQGRLNSPPSSNNVNNLADAVSRAANDAAQLKAKQQNNAQAYQSIEAARNRDFQREMQNQQLQEQNRRANVSYDRNKLDNYNNRQDETARQRQNSSDQEIARRNADRTKIQDQAFQREVMNRQRQSQGEAAQRQSMLENQRNQQSIQAQKSASDQQSRLQKERSEQGLISQREGVEGNSRLQKERSEQTSKLQSQVAAETAARTAGSRAAAIAAFQKFGKGR